MHTKVQLHVIRKRSHPLNIFRINSSKYVMFSWVTVNLLLRDSTSGPSLCFLLSAFNCLWLVSRCPLRVLATDINDVTSWSPTNEATWRYTLGGELRDPSQHVKCMYTRERKNKWESKPKVPWQSNHIIFYFLEQDVVKQRAILTFKDQAIPKGNQVLFEVFEVFLFWVVVIFHKTLIQC